MKTLFSGDKNISLLINKNNTVIFEEYEPKYTADTKDILSKILDIDRPNENLTFNINNFGKPYSIRMISKLDLKSLKSPNADKIKSCYRIVLEHMPAIWPSNFFDKFTCDINLPWIYLMADVFIDKDKFNVCRHPKMMFRVKICMSPNRLSSMKDIVYGVPLPNMWQEKYENGPWWICTGNISPSLINGNSIESYMKNLLNAMLLSKYSHTYIPSFIVKNVEKHSSGWPDYTKFNDWLQDGRLFGQNTNWPILKGTFKEFIEYET